MPGKRWDRRDEMLLLKMVKEGATLKDLAEIFGRKKDAVRMKLYRMGFKAKPGKRGRPRGTTRWTKLLRMMDEMVKKLEELRKIVKPMRLAFKRIVSTSCLLRQTYDIAKDDDERAER